MKAVCVISIGIYLLTLCPMAFSKENKDSLSTKLPAVKFSSDIPIAHLLQLRQSVRNFKAQSLSLEQVSFIAWAAAGKKIDALSSASRTAPSAGARYPIEIYLYVQPQGVKGLGCGLYLYQPPDHSLKFIQPTPDNKLLIKSCWDQVFINQSPAIIIISADFKRTTERYGQRGERYV